MNDIEVPIQDPKTIYAAMAAGGIIKSVNGGVTWTTLFDKEAVSTIGDGVACGGWTSSLSSALPVRAMIDAAKKYMSAWMIRPAR